MSKEVKDKQSVFQAMLMFRGMTKFTCDVWGNKYYARGGIFGKRIMILGESHYCDSFHKDE